MVVAAVFARVLPVRARQLAFAIQPLRLVCVARSRREYLGWYGQSWRSEEHTSELQSRQYLVCRLLLEKKNGARACAGHRAVLGYLVANEIPASIVRWHGARAVEKFVKQLHDEVKEQDPEALVSDANYPSTEYLDLSFLDLVCFNVFLESQDKYEAYLARLQNLAGNRPLLVTEIGLDSHRNGEKAQSDCLDWQVRKAFAAGCTGALGYA